MKKYIQALFKRWFHGVSVAPEILKVETSPERGLMTLGDHCRTTSGAPARYVGYGLCLYISCQDNELCMHRCRPATGGEAELPQPFDDEVHAALVAVDYIFLHGLK